MRNHRILLSLLGSLLVLGLAGAAAANDEPNDDEREELREERATVRERLEDASGVLDAILDAPDRGLPQDLLDRAACVAIIPSMKKAGLGIGGRYGRGVVSCGGTREPAPGARLR